MLQQVFLCCASYDLKVRTLLEIMEPDISFFKKDP